MNDPFAVLGLPARPDLTGDDIRAAWRRMAAATHPDRADGGDPARYAEAAAAYTTLRTASGRGEAYADLAGRRPGGRLRRGSGGRLRHGRPAVLALRTAAAAAVSAGALAAAGRSPPASRWWPARSPGWPAPGAVSWPRRPRSRAHRVGGQGLKFGFDGFAGGAGR